MRGKIYPKKISQKAKKSENKRQNHPKKRNSRESLHPEHQPKKPQKEKIQGYNSPKKNREIYPKKIS